MMDHLNKALDVTDDCLYAKRGVLHEFKQWATWCFASFPSPSWRPFGELQRQKRLTSRRPLWFGEWFIHVGVSKNRGENPQIIQIIHFNRVFHYFHHPFWGFSPYFWKHPCTFKANLPTFCTTIRSCKKHTFIWFPPYCKSHVQKMTKNCAWHQETNKKTPSWWVGGNWVRHLISCFNFSTHLLVHRAVFHSRCRIIHVKLSLIFTDKRKDLKFQPMAFGGWKKIWKVNKYINNT